MRGKKLPKNVRMLHGNSNPNPLAEMVRKSKEELPMLIEYMGNMARLHRAKYQALRDQGFSEPQALELCKSLF